MAKMAAFVSADPKVMTVKKSRTTQLLFSYVLTKSASSAELRAVEVGAEVVGGGLEVPHVLR